jgi:hypothetical protein
MTRSQYLLALILWLFVLLPLSWGVKKSVQKSLPLFSSPAK